MFFIILILIGRSNALTGFAECKAPNIHNEKTQKIKRGKRFECSVPSLMESECTQSHILCKQTSKTVAPPRPVQQNGNPHWRTHAHHLCTCRPSIVDSHFRRFKRQRVGRMWTIVVVDRPVLYARYSEPFDGEWKIRWSEIWCVPLWFGFYFSFSFSLYSPLFMSFVWTNHAHTHTFR